MGQERIAGRFSGAVLGLALGDALGAPHEGGPLERLVWAAIGTTRAGKRRWTDDTQMSLDLIDCLVERGGVDQDDLIARFARSHRWSRGYGPGTAHLLKRVRRGADWRRASAATFPGGSFGNGGAMRAPILGLFHGLSHGRSHDRFHSDAAERLSAQTRAATVVTHAHPLAVEGALIVAHATAAALVSPEPGALFAAARTCARSPDYLHRIATAEAWLSAGETPDRRQVASTLGNGVAAPHSCVTAVYLAARFLREDFAAMQAFIARCGGDADTIGAMAGALWGAANGVEALPADALDGIEDLPRLRAAAAALHAAARERSMREDAH